jgi:hypothetical protein
MSTPVTDAARVAALTERVQRLDAVVQAYEAQARAEGRALVCRGCAGAGVLDGVLCGDCHGAGTIAAKGAV